MRAPHSRFVDASMRYAAVPEPPIKIVDTNLQGLYLYRTSEFNQMFGQNRWVGERTACEGFPTRLRG